MQQHDFEEIVRGPGAGGRGPRDRFQFFVEAVQDYALLTLDVTGRVTSWNTGAERLNQYTADEVLGRHFSIFYPPADVRAGKCDRALATATREGRYLDEGWRVRKDGTRFWASVVLSAMRDDEGRLIGFAKVVRDLSERRASEEALRRSEERLHLLVDSVRDYAILLLDEEGRIASWNPGAERIKGYTADEAIGRSFEMFYPPEDRAIDKPRRLLSIAAREGRVEDEGWRVRKDGTRFWADVVLSAVRDETGQLRGYAKVVRDLSERRRAEESLRLTEERFRLLVENVRDYGIFMLAPDGRVASWNPGAERIQGYTAEEIVGQPVAVFYPEEDRRAGLPERELELAAREGRAETEGWRVRKDGTRFWADVVVTALRGPDGTLRGFAKVTRDSSERRRASEELQIRVREQAAVADLSYFALVARGPHEVMQRAVEVVASTLGVELGGVFELLPEGETLALRAGVGLREGDELPAGSRGHAGSALRATEPLVIGDLGDAAGALQQVQARSGIAARIAPSGPDGQPYGVLAAYSRERRAFSQDDAHFVQAVANVMAASVARARAERAAQAERTRAAEAHAALRERDEFLSVAAHELRTPLTALQLQLQGAELALRRSPCTDEAATGSIGKKLEKSLRHTERLAALVERLLDVSRLATGRLALAREEFDLAAMVREVVEDFRPVAERSATRLAVELPRELRGRWDRFRLEQVVNNVLSNALKYGAGRPVEVSLARLDGHALLRVRDHGIGIAAQDLDRIFDRFERANSVRHYGGLGLGLFIARQIVEAHGGTIRASGEPDRGATFEVDLPLDAPEPERAT